MPEQTFRLRRESVPRSIPGTGISWIAPGLLGTLDYDYKPAQGTSPVTSDLREVAAGPGDALDQALSQVGVLETHNLEMEAPTPEVERPEGVRSAAGPLEDDEMAIDYQPKPDEYSYILYQDENGAISIHFPENLPERTTEGATARSAVRTTEQPVQHYRIPLRKPVATEPEPGESTSRFGYATIGKKLLKLVVGKIVKKVFEPVVGAADFGAVWIWENAKRKFEGFHGGPNTDALLADEPTPLDAADWSALEGGGKRTLLFLHGTTSSTRGAFAELTKFPAVRDALYGKYDGRVIGFNHHTLTKSVADNVADFYTKLPAGGSFVFDIICHSRGGLIARALKELSPEQISKFTSRAWTPAARVTIGKIVFVGTPNIGTQLADPDDIPHALDLLANVAAFFPGAGLALAGVLSSAAYVAEAGFKALPGLQNMCPGNDFLTELNESAPAGAPSPLPDYYAIQSSFSLDGIVNQVLLAAVKYLFKGKLNDLIVPTLGVSEIDGTDLPSTVIYYYGKPPASDAVAHTRYFEHPDTWKEIQSALC